MAYLMAFVCPVCRFAVGLYPVLSYRNIRLVGGINFVVCLSAASELLKLRKEDRSDSYRGVSVRQLRRCSRNNVTKVNFHDVKIVMFWFLWGPG